MVEYYASACLAVYSHVTKAQSCSNVLDLKDLAMLCCALQLQFFVKGSDSQLKAASLFWQGKLKRNPILLRL